VVRKLPKTRSPEMDDDYVYFGLGDICSIVRMGDIEMNLLLLSWLTLANVGAAVFDVETTQSCLTRRVCHEANPFMPTSRTGQYVVKAGIIAPFAVWHETTNSEKAKWILIGILGTQIITGSFNLRF